MEAQESPAWGTDSRPTETLREGLSSSHTHPGVRIRHLMHFISAQSRNPIPQSQSLSFAYFTFLFLLPFFWKGIYFCCDSSPTQLTATHLTQFDPSCLPWVSLGRATTRQPGEKGKRTASSRKCAPRNIRKGGRKEEGGKPAHTWATSICLASWMCSFYILIRILWNRCYQYRMLQVRTAKLTLGATLANTHQQVEVRGGI